MTKAEELNFDLNEQPILFAETSDMSKTKLQHDIKDGSSVILKKGDIEVHIKNVKRNSDDSYIGKVDYILSETEKENETSIDGDGFEMTFLRDHVFVCQY
jgi:hypothetical protein